MASGSALDPLKLLRLTPLISSTGSLVYACSELIMNSAFLHPRIGSKSNDVLPVWYKTVFNRAIWLVVGLNAVSTSSAIANLLVGREELLARGSMKLYLFGLLGTIGHMVFVPFVMVPVRDIVEDRSYGHSCRDMEKWLRVHRIRMVVADTTAWVAYLAAVLATFSL